MIPKGMISLYVHILDFKYKILGWEEEDLPCSPHATIYVGLAGFAPEDPYKFEKKMYFWSREKEWTKTLL